MLQMQTAPLLLDVNYPLLVDDDIVAGFVLGNQRDPVSELFDRLTEVANVHAAVQPVGERLRGNAEF